MSDGRFFIFQNKLCSQLFSKKLALVIKIQTLFQFYLFLIISDIWNLEKNLVKNHIMCVEI